MKREWKKNCTTGKKMFHSQSVISMNKLHDPELINRSTDSYDMYLTRTSGAFWCTRNGGAKSRRSDRRRYVLRVYMLLSPVEAAKLFGLRLVVRTPDYFSIVTYIVACWTIYSTIPRGPLGSALRNRVGFSSSGNWRCCLVSWYRLIFKLRVLLFLRWVQVFWILLMVYSLMYLVLWIPNLQNQMNCYSTIVVIN